MADLIVITCHSCDRDFEADKEKPAPDAAPLRFAAQVKRVPLAKSKVR